MPAPSGKRRGMPRHRLASAALALALLTGAAACSDDDTDLQDVTENESVAPGSREEGTPETPLNEGDDPSEDATVPSEQPSS
jgi:hypothetical protein